MSADADMPVAAPGAQGVAGDGRGASGRLRAARAAVRAFFAADAARVGLSGACVLVLAVLVIAHMPVVADVGYAPWDLEVLGTLAVLSVVAAAAAAALRRWPPVLYAFACFWLYWAADAYVPDQAAMFWAPDAMALSGLDWTVEQWALLQCIVLPVLVWVFLNSRWSENLRAMIAAFAMVWLVGLWAGDGNELLTQEAPVAVAPQPVPATARTRFHAADGRLRPVIHVILDEQASPRSLGHTVPVRGAVPGEAAHRAAGMVDGYVARGFTFYAHVASSSSRTQESLSAVMGLGQPSAAGNLNSPRNGRFAHEVLDNRYVDALVALGYRVTVVQNNYLRLCPPGDKVVCMNYAIGMTGSPTAHVRAAVSERAAVLLAQMHSAYFGNKAHPVVVYQKAHAALRALGVDAAYQWVYYSSPLAALNLMHWAEDRFRALQPGDAYVMHLLLPHFPYMTGEDCRIKPSREWTSPARHLAPGAPAVAAAKVYGDYWDQSACAHERVMALVDTARRHAAVEPIVFVHGDHGARVVGTFDDMAKPDLEDADMHGTFLAVYAGQAGSKEPARGVEVDAAHSLPQLFAAVVGELQRPSTAGAAGR